MSDEYWPPGSPPPDPPEPPATPPPASGGGVGMGLLISLGVPALLLLIGLPILSSSDIAPLAGVTEILFGIFGPLVLFIGLSQLLYIVPTAIWAYAKGKKGMVTGLAIGGGIVFLLNAACFGLVFAALGQWSG